MQICRYETFIELGFTDFNYYGYRMLAPKHDRPHYDGRDSKKRRTT